MILSFELKKVSLFTGSNWVNVLNCNLIVIIDLNSVTAMKRNNVVYYKTM